MGLFILSSLVLNILLNPPTVAAADSHINPPKKEEVNSIEEDRLKFTMLQNLLENSHQSLKGKKFCKDFVSNGQTNIGKFIAWNLSFFEENVANSISVTCTNSKSSRKCSVNFAADSKGESPWSCGLRFDYNSKKHKIDFQSLECIGTC